ncbi:MAG: hypothetical protein ACI9PP_000400 [Halobacteriales archaeon]
MSGVSSPLPRRALLAATAGALSAGERLQVDRVGASSGIQLGIRVYPDERLGWAATARDVHRHLGRSVEELQRIARDRLDRPVDFHLERGPVVPREPLDFEDGRALWRSFRDWLEEADAPEGQVSHLFLARAPFAPDLGYGIAFGQVLDDDPLGAQAIANVGATETWDDRTVTRNMAIHEVFHTLIRDRDARTVNGSPCEHDLGAVVGETPDRVFVTPLATSYAGESGGEETTWHGTGCYHHERFAQYDVHPDLETDWYHTWVPSAATCEAIVRYLRDW